MNLLRFLLLMHITTLLVLGQAAHRKHASPANRPEALVRSLYTQVLARHPLGVPDDADMKVFAPYLSKALLHRMDLAIACGADWHRQNPEPHLKPALSWLELGPFSGDNERASPQSFLIERTQSEKDGSFRVYARLTRAYPEGSPSIWRIAAIVILENGHFVVDDVIYLKDKELDENRGYRSTYLQDATALAGLGSATSEGRRSSKGKRRKILIVVGDPGLGEHNRQVNLR
jgi:hypothetical protein